MRRLPAFAAISLALLAAGQASQAQAQNPISRLFSCEQSGRKQEGGAALGAVVGGLLGSQVSKNERALGAVAGAALGAGIGSYVGCRMQSTDQARAQAATKAALDQGRSQTWSNPQTGARGRVDVLEASYGPAIDGGRFRFDPGVQPYTSYEAVGGQYFAPGVANLRGSASTAAPVVGRLASGEAIDVLGSVGGGAWLLVGRNGNAAGYVAKSVVRPIGTTPASNCRTIQTTTSVRGYGDQAERFNACRDNRGEWQLTAI